MLAHVAHTQTIYCIYALHMDEHDCMSGKQPHWCTEAEREREEKPLEEMERGSSAPSLFGQHQGLQ